MKQTIATTTMNGLTYHSQMSDLCQRNMHQVLNFF